MLSHGVSLNWLSQLADPIMIDPHNDTMARLRFNHTDEAFKILTTILERIDNDLF